MVSREKFISAGVLYLIVLGLCLKAIAAKPSTEHIILTTQNWTGKYDAAGHVEESKWDYSQYHPHGYHDLLSGEWGAGFRLTELPRKLEVPSDTIPKLIDGYYWLTITKGLTLPDAANLRRWAQWLEL